MSIIERHVIVGSERDWRGRDTVSHAVTDRVALTPGTTDMTVPNRFPLVFPVGSPVTTPPLVAVPVPPEIPVSVCVPLFTPVYVIVPVTPAIFSVPPDVPNPAILVTTNEVLVGNTCPAPLTVVDACAGRRRPRRTGRPSTRPLT